MASWDDVATADAHLASRVRARFDAHKHKMMATLRKDGSPRLSGVEVMFHGGDLWVGMMDGSLKARDLQRDPRLALHSAPLDVEMAAGDAKVAGRAIEITDPATFADFVGALAVDGAEHPEEGFHLFRVDVGEVVLTTIGEPADHLVIESWHEGEGSKRVERA